MSQKLIIKTTGITCNHCTQHVTAELTAIPNITEVQIELVPQETSTITITTETNITDSQIFEALEEAGDYPIIEILRPND